MSDKETVEAETSAAPAEVSSSPAFEPEGEVTMPEGWMYRQRRFLGLNIPWYASPKTQLIIVAFVCFMCPGMFNALGGMGGGGKTTNTTADNMVGTTFLASETLLTIYDRILPFTPLSRSLDSLVEPLSTNLVSSTHWHSEVLDTAFTLLHYWFPSTALKPLHSILLLVCILVCVQVFCGLRRELS
jgi:hypothetical protein